MRDYICVIGSLNYDVIVKQERMPLLGETYIAESVTYSGGGKGANQAVQCAKLGIDTIMVGAVGRDVFGDTLMEQMMSYGVDCSYIGRSSCPTGVGVVHALNDGSVYASIIAGANSDVATDKIDELDEVIRNSRMVVLQLEIPTGVVEYIIQKAKKYQVYSILNAAPAKEISWEVLNMTDCLIVNESEASFYAGAEIATVEDVTKCKDRLRSLTRGTIIVTLGAKGSVLLEKHEVTVIDAVKAPQVVDSTGAGDSYIGAFAFGKFNGLSDVCACRQAASVAAITVTKVGAQEAMPQLKEINHEDYSESI